MTVYGHTGDVREGECVHICVAIMIGFEKDNNSKNSGSSIVANI